ncbi:hypothetical protein V6N13_138164 [Hibiscus sabdariffa]
MASTNGDWRWDLFERFLPHVVLLRIAAIKGPLPSMADATIGWKLSSTKQFDLRTVYEVRLGGLDVSPDKVWRIIHRFWGLQRIRIFLWLVCMNKVLTNEECRRRHFTQDACCPICHHMVEDGNHMLRFFPHSLAIWQQLIIPGKLNVFLGMDICRWVIVNFGELNDLYISHNGNMAVDFLAKQALSKDIATLLATPHVGIQGLLSADFASV